METYPLNNREVPVWRLADLTEAEALMQATPEEHTLILREDLPGVAATVHSGYPCTPANLVAVVILEDDHPGSNP